MSREQNAIKSFQFIQSKELNLNSVFAQYLILTPCLNLSFLEGHKINVLKEAPFYSVLLCALRKAMHKMTKAQDFVQGTCTGLHCGIVTAPSSAG